MVCRSTEWMIGTCTVLLLSACATTYKDDRAVGLDTRIYPKANQCYSEDPALTKTCIPGLTEQEVLEKEKEIYPSYPGSTPTHYRPNLAIGLSGGGQRASSTAIGFLAGLDSTGVLAKADILSTVSGGSYAAYWYMTKLYQSEFYHNPIGYDDKNTPHRFAPFFDRYYIYCRDDSPPDSEKWNKNCDFRTEGQPPLLTPDSKKTRGNKWARFQHHVSYHGNLLTTTQQSDDYVNPLVWPEIILRSLVVLPYIPMHWVTAGLLDAKINNNRISDFYVYGIEHEYVLYPKLRGAREVNEFENATTVSWLPWTPLRLNIAKDSPSDVTLDSLARLAHEGFNLETGEIKKRPIPFWIINSTAAYGGGWKLIKNLPVKYQRYIPPLEVLTPFNNSLQDTIYEFTPIARGSSSYGYFPNSATTFSHLPDGLNTTRQPFLVPHEHQFFPFPPLPITLSKIVGISGAAIDDLGFAGNVAIDSINFGLGQYINNPAQPNSVRNRHQWIPFPFNLFGFFNPRIKHDIHAPSIYLSDGGHSDDNLGISSALKRRPHNLLVLDAELEGNRSGLAAFESLQRVVCRMRIERGISFQFRSNFEETKRLTEMLNKEPCGSPEKEPGTGIVDGKAPKDFGFDVRKTAMPYFEATIQIPCSVPGNGNEIGAQCSDEEKKSSVTETRMIYVKLAVDGTRIPRYNKENICEEGQRYQCETQFYYQEASTKFPHHATWDINYSKVQFAGYRALGFDLGKCIGYSDTEAIFLNNDCSNQK